ncbi:MAG TPA: trypsin-like serine protease [Steroidobacteraceae bacterium]|nr:trypsin-like serine protease [Steroidobacteraceae bacterium]
MKANLYAVLMLASSLHAVPAGAQENIGTVQSPLISPIVVTEQQQEQLGLLQMTAGGRGCSASLLTNSWAISAAHCLRADAMRSPNTVQLNGNWGANAQLGNADYIYRSWGLDYPGVMYDFALIHLQNPMRVNGSTTGYVRELSELSLADMKNVNVAVYGRGMNVLAVKNGNNFMASSGDNQFRSFVFTVNRTEPNLFWYPAGPNGEMVGGGDSGGPSFEMTRGVPRIAGVHASCHADCLEGKSCPADDQWTWISKIDECGDAPVGYIRTAIQDLTRQMWNPALAVQTLQVRHTEAQVRKEMMLGRLDSLPWDYVRRAAMMACQNRGFDFGFFDGNAQEGVSYQVRCVNASAARWFDAVPADMVRINDRFATIAQTRWAQGARAANDICRNREPASVGGLFTGHEFKTSPSGGFADQRNGVFCFNHSHARWFDATQGELAAQGTPIGDLNATGWAVAGRAANEYCKRKFYPSGGFFNGHQLNDRRGIVCIGKNTVMSDRINVGESFGAARAQAATGGKPSVAAITQADLDSLAARGAGIAAQDPLSVELRERAAEGAAKRGFDIGMAATEGQTQDGPGKKRVRDALSPAEQEGFDVALSFSLQRNANAARAAVGAAIARSDNEVAEARAREPDVFYWLGFDIASGIFGDPAAGAQGNTQTGPGSLGIRNALSPAAQRGFNASVALHLGRKYR